MHKLYRLYWKGVVHMKEMHMFAGVNSSVGFFSRFHDIMPDAPGKRKIFIKGGPGMGKSTLMKKIIRRASEIGFPLEVYHCSSDPSSVDGVHIPSLKTAIVDATAPHLADPMYPCVGGEIFDVSVHVRKEKLLENRDHFEVYQERKKRAFSKGYQYLAAALPLLRQVDAEHKEQMDAGEIYAAAEKLADRILGKTQAHQKGDRELFVSAITPEGFVNYAETVFGDTYTVSVKGKFGTSLFVERFYEIARMRGHGVMRFPCPVRPQEKLEHLYIPALRFSLTTYDLYTHVPSAEMIDLDMYQTDLAFVGEDIGYAGSLMQRAIDAFADAKTAHGFLEKLYVPAMDFDALEERSEALINSIF